MKTRLNIPEADSLRRIAASLASALSTEAVFRGRIDTNLSTGLFFRSFPWTGVARVPVRTVDHQTSTVGQFFAAFNWEGVATEKMLRAGAPQAKAPVPTAPSQGALDFLDSYLKED